jgi:hypothetical protein
MAEDALPMAASLEELRAARQQATKASQSVLTGNERYMESVRSGKSDASSGSTQRKTINGVTYEKRSDGHWYPVNG